MELMLSPLPAPPKILSEIHRTAIGLPPTFSRLPPDGHEFPQTYSEPNNNTVTTNCTTVAEQLTQSKGSSQKPHILDTNISSGGIRFRPEEAPPLPKSGPPTAGPRKVFRQNLVINVNDRSSDANIDASTVISTSAKPSASASNSEDKQIQKLTMLTTPSPKNGKFDAPLSKKPIGHQRQCAWRKDEKSEKSVRDKIAMFSNDTDAVDSPNTTGSAIRKMFNRSVDNLLSDEFTINRSECEVDHSSGLSMIKKAMSVENLDDSSNSGRYSSTYENNNYIDEYMLKAFSVENLTNVNGKIVEKGVKTLPRDEKKVSSIPLTYASLPRSRPQLVARTTSFSGPSPNQEERRRSAISNLLEQRKKSMTKLRGLVIPEKASVGDNDFGQVLFDLPEIKSTETCALPQTPQTTVNGKTMKREPLFANYSRSFSNTATPSEVTPGYTSIFTNSGTSLRATVSTNSASKRPVIQPLVLPPVKPPRTSLISSGRSSSDIQRSNCNPDDSDSDSVFSAKISSPPGSPIVQATPGKFALTRTLSSETNTSIASSTTSTLTSGSGSQASCSSLGSTPNVDMSRKISKSSSNDSYANRKNILALAKCRSGKDDSGPIGHRQHRRPYEDEDSTDGYEEEEVMRHHAPKPKQRSLLAISPKTQTPYLPPNQPINYRLVTSADNAVDMVINVASYVEVTSDTDGDSKHSDTSTFKVNTKFIDEERRASFKAVKEEPKTIPKTPPRSPISICKPTSSPKIEENNNIRNNIKNHNTDMSQWVRSEVARSKQIEKPTPIFPSKPLTVSRNIQKFNQGSSLEAPKAPQATFTTTKVISVKSSSTKLDAIKTNCKPIVEKTSDKIISKSSYHERFSSLDSLASSSSSGISSSQASSLLDSSPTNMQSATNDFGSFSSFGSNHSLITPADLQLIIEEADPPLKRAEAVVVVMQRDSPECSVGVTLAGGADYETKEITIHRVLMNSPAYKDGRLRKGDRILSINGLSMRGLTHRESVAVLKTPRLEVVMVVTRSESLQPSEITLKNNKESAANGSGEIADRRRQTYQKQSPTLHLDLDIVSNEGSYTYDENKSTCGTAESSASSLGDEVVYSINPEKLITSSSIKTANRGRVVEIFKDNCGLGLAIEGGLDSPNGHCPLTVKKVFMGGAAEKTGQVRPGDIIVAINDFNTEKVTRVQAWNFMKSLPCGSTKFHLTST